jgi:pimeloyl-ACP methyl ester carboxylesterase
MIIFAHGLEGTPNGSKIQALRSSGFEVLAPDFQGMVLSERVALLEEICNEHADAKPILAGSSYGGLTAAIVAMRTPHQFSGLLLCAPALHLKEDPVDDETVLVAPKGMPTVIVHGIGDDIVPISCSIEYAERSGNDILQFHKVDDGHRLAESHSSILEGANALYSQTIDS